MKEPFLVDTDCQDPGMQVRLASLQLRTTSATTVTDIQQGETGPESFLIESKQTVECSRGQAVVELAEVLLDVPQNEHGALPLCEDQETAAWRRSPITSQDAVQPENTEAVQIWEFPCHVWVMCDEEEEK